jgi:hypothetical protein
MVSKTQRRTFKAGCRHIFVQGPKKGQQCKRNCRNNKFCCEHSNRKKEADKMKYQRRKQKIMETQNKDIFNRINNAKSIKELPSHDKLTNDMRIIRNKLIKNRRQILGIRKFLGEDIESIILNLHNLKFGKCQCENGICTRCKKEREFSKKFKKEHGYDERHQFEQDNGFDNTITEKFGKCTCGFIVPCQYHTELKKKYTIYRDEKENTFEKKYGPCKCKKQCKSCNMKNDNRWYTEYQGKNKEIAIKRKLRSENKLKILLDKYKYLEEIRKVLLEKINELEKDN